MLRPYQEEALNGAHNSLREHNSSLGIMATGGGKTTVFSILTNHCTQGWGGFPRNGRVLILVNRRQLLRQTALEVQAVVGIVPAIEQAEHHASLHASVIIASVDTIANRLKKYPPDHFCLMVLDECHLLTGQRAQKVMNYFICKKLGVTATPWTKGKRALSKFYDHIAFDIPLLRLIKEGWLAPITVAMSPLKISLDGIKMRKGDFDEHELTSTITPYFDAICGEMTKHPYRKWLCFLPLIESSKEFADALNRNRIRAAHVDGTMDIEPQLKAFKRGELDALTCSQMLYFGYDEPSIDGIVNLRQTKSINFYEQLIGRGTRKSEDTLKNDCIAEGTLILTDQGEIPIENVNISMKLWDGTCFASHGGIIFKGEQKVITYEGLTATPDHPVWTKEGWKLFASCAAEQTPIAITSRSGEAIREVEGYFTGASKKPIKAVCRVHGLRQSGVEASTNIIKWNCGLSKVRKSQSGRAQMAMESMQQPKTTMHESIRQEVGRLWRQGHSIQIRKPNGGSTMGARQSWATSPSAIRSNRKQGALRTGQYSLVNQQGEYVPYAQAFSPASTIRVQKELSRSLICGQNLISTFLSNDRRRNSGPLEPTGTKKVRTWDILNCGKFNRFTAAGLLVHNCLVLDFLWQYADMGLVRPSYVLTKDAKDGEEMHKRVLASSGPVDLVKLHEEVIEDKHKKLKSKLHENAKKRGKIISIKDLIIAPDPDLAFIYEHVPTYKPIPISAAQLSVLANHGVDTTEVRDSEHAAKIISWLRHRIETGVASLKQVNLLKRLGMPHHINMSFKQASAYLDMRLNK